MKQILNIILVAIFTISNVSFAQTKVDGSLLKGNVIGGTAANNRRLVLPKDTKANLDALTNLEGNTVWATDTKKAYINNGTALVPIGSGSGGGVNYITDGDAESATSSIFIPYQDSSGTRPVDGTGGTTTGITTDITSTSPLEKLKSFRLIKDAANRQGGGWSVPFSIDSGYRSGMNKISVQYIVDSGTFVAGSDLTESDVIWYLYDITNAKLLEPQKIKMLTSSTTNGDVFQADFQPNYVAPATASQYRLIAHIQSTSALAYTLKLDTISISPSQYVYAPVVTDWKSYTPTGAWTSNTTYSGKYRQVGDTMEIEATVVLTGAPTAAEFNITIPSGFLIDTTKLTSTDANKTLGTISSITAANYYHGSLWYFNTTTLKASMTPTASASANSLINVSNTNPATFANGDRVYIKASVPILGWTSNTQVSDGYEYRPAVASGYGSATGINTAVVLSKISLNSLTTTSNDGLMIDTANSRVNIKTSGKYFLKLSTEYNTGSPTISAAGNRIYVNGSPVGQTRALTTSYGRYVENFVVMDLKANEYVEFYAYGEAGFGGTQSYIFSVSKDQAPTTMSAQSRISASYAISGAPSTTINTQFNYSVKEWDTHGAVTVGASWKFTAPVFGEYDILVAGSNGGSININIYKNGTLFKTIGTYNSTDQRSFNLRLELNAGEYIDARPNATTSHSGFIQIRRVN